MKDDDHLCLCFHVTKRKVVNFLRIEKPAAASQLSACHGAGEGCGWCRPFLKKLFQAYKEGQAEAELPQSDDYVGARGEYIKSGKGTPPPGTS